MKITAEDLLKVEREINDKYCKVSAYVVCGHLCIEAKIKERVFRETFTPDKTKNEPKKLLIDRFAHYAKKYLLRPNKI